MQTCDDEGDVDQAERVAVLEELHPRPSDGLAERQVVDQERPEEGPAEGAGEPAKLVFTGSRPAMVEVPFTLKDVPLP